MNQDPTILLLNQISIISSGGASANVTPLINVFYQIGLANADFLFANVSSTSKVFPLIVQIHSNAHPMNGAFPDWGSFNDNAQNCIKQITPETQLISQDPTILMLNQIINSCMGAFDTADAGLQDMFKQIGSGNADYLLANTPSTSKAFPFIVKIQTLFQPGNFWELAQSDAKDCLAAITPTTQNDKAA